MTLREFLKEIGVNVYEDTQGTLDLEMKIFAEDSSIDTQSVEVDFNNEIIEIRLVDIEQKTGKVWLLPKESKFDSYSCSHSTRKEDNSHAHRD